MAEDTIAAIATAAGPAGVGVVRLSGPHALAIASELLGTTPDQLDRTVRLRWVHDRAGRRLDQVLAFAMRAPRSFTGEDVVELQGHGGVVNMQRLLAAALACGARLAEPGELTRRAFENGKIDLLRAESLLGVIQAGSDRAWRLAQANLDGQLGSEVAALERRTLALLAELEGWIDFPEEDLEAQSAAWIDAELAALAASCAHLAGTFRHGRAIASGIVVALVGPVNAGKSSLLNALVGSERALVDAAPGTTRDWLEVPTVWDGVAVTLVDTAGLRPTDDPIERRGIALGASRVQAADVVLLVNDGTAPLADASRYGGAARALHVRSKVDLDADAMQQDAEIIATSAHSGVGLADLRARVLALAGVAEREGSEHATVTTERQHALIHGAGAALAAARREWLAKRPPEVVAIEIRSASQRLAQLRGVEVGERMLDELFARFCIGK